MLGAIRKFSTSIFAKILLGIIVIPFIFWGMGSTFKGGNKNVIATIDNEKYSIKEFVDYIQMHAPGYERIGSNEIENILSAFIGEKLVTKEVEYFGIRLSDFSLSKLIKHQKDFKRDNVFSRTEYEKFLLKNNISAVNFEYIISKKEKKKQLLDLISGGISPPKSLVNVSYDRINQKRSVELINLNDVFLKNLNFTNDQIKNFYEDNKDKYTDIYKSGKILELNPKKLVNTNEFNDLFFKKIDEIDDLIVSGEKLDSIIKNFNLGLPTKFKINKEGKDFNNVENKNISENMLVKIFDIDIDDPVTLIEEKNKYFIIELLNTENVLKDFNNNSGLPFPWGIVRNAVRFVFDNPIGSISDPINVDNGIVVFHITGSKDAGYRSFEDVKSGIKRTLIRDEKKKSFCQKVQEKRYCFKNE